MLTLPNGFMSNSVPAEEPDPQKIELSKYNKRCNEFLLLK